MANQGSLIRHTLILDKLGPTINVPIRYSKKAKRIIIKINNKGAELVLPNKQLGVGYKFLLDKESWVRKKLHSKTQGPKIDNSTGNIHSLLCINSNNNAVKIIENIIHVYSLPNLHIQVLVEFLKNKLLLKVTETISSLPKHLGLHINEIKIMNNKTRWGTCSSKGVLRFNWRLVFAPQEILYYVIIHEICHLVEMNHSKLFWRLVTNLYPNYQSARLWLKKNGCVLHEYCNSYYSTNSKNNC